MKNYFVDEEPRFEEDEPPNGSARFEDERTSAQQDLPNGREPQDERQSKHPNLDVEKILERTAPSPSFPTPLKGLDQERMVATGEGRRTSPESLRWSDELFLRKYKSYWQVESKNRLDARTRAFKEAIHEADGFKGCIPGECLYSQDVGFFRRTIRIYQID